MDGMMDGWDDGWMDGWMDGWGDGWVERDIATGSFEDGSFGVDLIFTLIDGFTSVSVQRVDGGGALRARVPGAFPRKYCSSSIYIVYRNYTAYRNY